MEEDDEAKRKAKDRKELADFLAKVDEIGDLVKGLTSSDSHTSSEAIAKADEYLERRKKEKEEEWKGGREEGGAAGVVVQDRTVINRRQESSTPSDKSRFCQALEEDARERAEGRKERERVGREKKRKGNEAFRKEEYHSAVEHYTEAIQQMPWDVTLYTNRALAYNRVGKYEQAIGDCETAIKLEPNTLKAYLQKGKACVSLHKLNQAEDCYQEACKLFPQETDKIKGYIQELKDVKQSKHCRT